MESSFASTAPSASSSLPTPSKSRPKINHFRFSHSNISFCLSPKPNLLFLTKGSPPCQIVCPRVKAQLDEDKNDKRDKEYCYDWLKMEAYRRTYYFNDRIYEKKFHTQLQSHPHLSPNLEDQQKKREGTRMSNQLVRYDTTREAVQRKRLWMLRNMPGRCSCNWQFVVPGANGKARLRSSPKPTTAALVAISTETIKGTSSATAKKLANFMTFVPTPGFKPPRKTDK
ncbi:hypothetical protein Ahy_B03g064718 [Arachis hypogaea]|uniref:Uncharacterized protein n=1 Tax=Arachis hypogaea TaxID=3818 RepID=A0A445A090_ARAHY|nr:hypothetical protein Ahy_B03g064718 [Arachis hypogaea]